jgi:hypothetical protein
MVSMTRKYWGIGHYTKPTPRVCAANVKAC